MAGGGETVDALRSLVGSGHAIWTWEGRRYLVPANAGILGVAFLNCFPGGVEFRWGDADTEPSLTLYGDAGGTAVLSNHLPAG